MDQSAVEHGRVRRADRAGTGPCQTADAAFTEAEALDPQRAARTRSSTAATQLRRPSVAVTYGC